MGWLNLKITGAHLHYTVVVIPRFLAPRQDGWEVKNTMVQYICSQTNICKCLKISSDNRVADPDWNWFQMA
jgi:hypothetical protein